MSLPTSHLAYADCFEVLDAALEDTYGVRFPVDDQDKATHLRMRIHMARKIDRERNAELYPDPGHPLHGRSQYDKIVVRIKEDGNRLYIYLEQLESHADALEPLSEVVDNGKALPKPKEFVSVGSKVVRRI